jgi:hypothetical protein
MQQWVTLIVSAFSDFAIAAGGALLTAMTATQSVSAPNTPAIIFAVVTGMIAAARSVQKNLSPAVKP